MAKARSFASDLIKTFLEQKCIFCCPLSSFGWSHWTDQDLGILQAGRMCLVGPSCSTSSPGWGLHNCPSFDCAPVPKPHTHLPSSVSSASQSAILTRDPARHHIRHCKFRHLLTKVSEPPRSPFRPGHLRRLESGPSLSLCRSTQSLVAQSTCRITVTAFAHLTVKQIWPHNHHPSFTMAPIDTESQFKFLIACIKHTNAGKVGVARRTCSWPLLNSVHDRLILAKWPRS